MRFLLLLFLVPLILSAQLTTGIVEGALRDALGRPASHVVLFIAGDAGFQTTVRGDSEGRFTLSLPYGGYTISTQLSATGAPAVSIEVRPLRTTYLELATDNSGHLHKSLYEPGSKLSRPASLDVSSEATAATALPEGFVLQSTVSTLVPGAVTVPPDFTGLADNRLALVSVRSLSWTNTQLRWQGLDATDSYQPGRPVILPDMQGISDVVLREDFNARSYGDEIGVFSEEPSTSWRGSISTFGTGSALSSSNLPEASGTVQQRERFEWFTRERLEIEGPLAPWADVFASVSGQWASQTVQSAPRGQDQNSGMLFGQGGGYIHPDPHDTFDALYSISRSNLSTGGVPAGIEALTSRRESPEFNLPDGFPDQAEADAFHFLQLGWAHQHGAGTFQLRYGYSTARLNTWPAAQALPNQSRVELLGSSVTGDPPLDTLATRPRHEIAASWQPPIASPRSLRHQITVGGNWELSSPRNRMTAPSDLNLNTVAGAPAFVVEYNTPVNSLERIETVSAYVADHVALGHGLSLNFGAVVDISRGSLPRQSSPAGSFTPARNFPGSGDLIAWNSTSPRAGFAWRLPFVPRIVIEGGYGRFYSPLAARYLDYGNPNSLGGSVYRWTDLNHDGWFETDEQSSLISRFGGPYSSISHSLRPPYADEFDLAARLAITSGISGSVHLFRRDEKQRIVALDSGLGANAFTPVQVLDPGPDGIPGTFDDRPLTVYEQNPATFGADHFTLMNSRDLRELNAVFVAEIRSEWHGLHFAAAFTAEKAWGPTNPGNAAVENDPDVIGTLFIDPNSAEQTLARSYVDRAYIGQMQALYRFPSFLGGLEVASIANYLDGLPFARQLLVPNLAQGPFLIATTVRGSPEGGDRSQYIVNWNLRLGREFALKRGRLFTVADLLNVMNSAQAIQESDLTGSSFNLRLPVSLQPARFVRLGLTYSF
jgi:hypothetical protein